jgi:6-phosphogluconolactonase/glucosamine-6-phosphate isomerase/deaminase
VTESENEIWGGDVLVTISETEEEMGSRAADQVVEELLYAVAEEKEPVLWLMAAPSGFAFYDALVAKAEKEAPVRHLLQGVPIYQFDDYPIARDSDRFPVTFRHLLEERIVTPLKTRMEVGVDWRPLELTENGDLNEEILQTYQAELLERLRDPGARVVEVKGIGMDGHWGFHGAETPLDSPAGMMRVPMNSQNITQQMLDWPEYFPSREDVPTHAYTCNVAMFMEAQAVIDVVPQSTKEYSVLATYGTDAVLNEIPSSALKRHPRATAFLTQAAARALLEFREISPYGAPKELPPETLDRLKKLWDDPKDPDGAAENTREMMKVLRKLGLAR